MEDRNVSDRLKTRLSQFGQFFKGFFSKNHENAVQANQHIYDDTQKFQQEKNVLEYQAPINRQGRDESRPNMGSPRRGWHDDHNLFDKFGPTKTLFEEFEESMKIFDEFSYILQQPNIGLPPSVNPNMEDDDEQEARYFKFFGNRGGGSLQEPPMVAEIPSESNEVTKEESKLEENFRHLMVKPDHSQSLSKPMEPENFHPFWGIFDSLWKIGERPNSSSQMDTYLKQHPNPGNASFFSFSSEGRVIKSDGINVTVDATKIQDTAEGREIITYRTNADGVTEEIRDFIPRKDLPPGGLGMPNYSILGRFFGPPPRL